MGARELHHALECAGFKIVAEGSLLLVRPAANLLPEMRRQIVAHKAELLDIAPRRSWRISLPGRDSFGVTCPQGATADEILAQWPGAVVEAM